MTVFEPMYLDIIDDDMVGFANIIAREMLDHLFITYGNITAVDLEFVLNKFAAHGTLINLLSPFSKKFKIVLIILKKGAL
jgi:hypothetical protein